MHRRIRDDLAAFWLTFPAVSMVPTSAENTPFLTLQTGQTQPFSAYLLEL